MAPAPQRILITGANGFLGGPLLAALRAVARVREHRPVRLIILGEGPDRPELEQLVATLGLASCVDLAGFEAKSLPLPVPKLTVRAVVGVGGLADGADRSHGLRSPCAVHGLSLWAKRDSPGRRAAPLVEVGDPDALARGILAALDDPPDRTALRSRAREFSLAASSTEYLCYIRSLC